MVSSAVAHLDIRIKIDVDLANDVCLYCRYKPTIVRSNEVDEHGVGRDFRLGD